MHKNRSRYTKIGWQRYLYACHKFGAGRRNIPFEFSFEEWRKWWEDHLGPDWIKLRGNKPNQYHMARYGDKGPYKADNVKCVTARENRKEGGTKNIGENNGHSKLTANQIVSIRKARGKQRDIAKKFGISQASVNHIKLRNRWKHI